MLSKRDIKIQINNLIAEKLFSAIRNIILAKERERFIHSTEYKISHDKKTLLDSQYQKWFSSISNFFLSYQSIYALSYIVKSEQKIRNFVQQDVIRIKADYTYDGIDFSAYYPTHYTIEMNKEIDDCIAELRNPKYTHKVDNYTHKKDTEKAPHEPLTTAKLKYSAFYLLNFTPEYTTYLANALYGVNLITNPETNGWNIDNETVEDIITVLNQKYSPDIVLQYKRNYTDKNKDRYDQECVRPTIVSTRYFPRELKETREFNSIDFQDNDEKIDALELYKFIFYITLSTQLKNSIYDTSSIEIKVGPKTLKEQASVVIKGQENWEQLTGSVIKRISRNSDTSTERVVVIPEVPANKELLPTDIYAYSYPKKRPRRYGVGRFLTQVLEKENIGNNSEHDEILKNLIDSKSVIQVKNMLIPQENSVILIEWIKEYLPLLIDKDYLSELEEKITLVESGDLIIESLIKEIDRLIDSAFELSGFEFDDSKPSKAKINLVKSIAMKHNLTLSDEILNSKIKTDLILAKYPMPKPIKIGNCPSCNSLVYQKEYISANTGEVFHYFSCENFSKKSDGCKFSLWDSYIYKFFSDKAIELYTVEERAATLKKILSKKKGYLFNDFIAKNQKPYDAKVITETYQDRKTQELKWQLALVFVNKKR